MARFRVLATYESPLDHLQPLDGLADIVIGQPRLTRADVLRLAPEADAIITYAELRVDAELLDAAPRLRIVANVAIGTDNLDKPAMAARGVWATNTPSSFVECSAENTFALMLAIARRIPLADAYMRTGQWEHDGIQFRRWEGTCLAGKTLGLVGFGGIGQAVAVRAEAFGMRVLYTTAVPRADARWRPLPELLRAVDILSLHCPLTDATRGLIDAAALAALRPGAVLINMARGPVVDEAALVAALQSGHLGGAGLDVFEREPQVHPELLKLPQVVLTPHIGGATYESRRHARTLAAENVARVLRGEPPLTPMNTPVCRA